MKNHPMNVRWDFGALPKFSHTAARYAIGISHARGERCLRAALVRSLGRGHEMVCDPIEGSSIEIPADLLRFLSHDIDSGNLDIHELAFWRSELADRCSILAKPFIARAKRDHQEPLAICVDGLYAWAQDELGQRRHHSLCDATALAEKTGITVVDDLPGADLAHNGMGFPMTGVADWILFGDRSGMPGYRNRAILRFGPSIRVTVVPSRTTRTDPPVVIPLDAGPGIDLFDAVRDAIGLHAGFESKTAVQEPPFTSLVTQWCDAADESSMRDNARLVDWIVSQVKDYESSRRVSAAGWMMTCLEFVARNAARRITDGLPPSIPVCEIILTGDLHLDGLLQNRLCHYMPGPAIRSGEPIAELSRLDPIATAVMAFLRIDNAIGNSTRQTGTEKPRPLGRLTPGRPSNWNSVLAEMAAGMRQSMTLKTAV